MAGTLPAMEVDKKVNHSPHVVILGAGASRACCLDGDKNGLRLPLMDEHFVAEVGLESFLKEHEIEYKGIGFEALYSKLHDEGFPELSELDRIVREHFLKFELPDAPTIYDLLVMSLRKKDVIVSFNWDPLLMQAYRRNAKLGDLPNVLFLHGNVSVGVCLKDKVKGYLFNPCGSCYQEFNPTQLLYPVANKDYENDDFIKAEWQELRWYLEHAYMITIFGYGAPKTDVAAIDLMKNVWNQNKTRELAEIEIIDIREEDDLLKTWDDFIIEHHYMTTDSFSKSYISRHPRRSCDAFAWATLQCEPWKDNFLPEFKTLDEYHNWLSPHIEEEKGLESENGKFSGKPIELS